MQHALFALSPRFLRLNMGCQNVPKTKGKLSVNNMCKFQKFTISCNLVLRVILKNSTDTA